jgi:type I restriction enzyme M protein
MKCLEQPAAFAVEDTAMSLSLRRRRELRRLATPAEKTLWFHLRGRRFASFKFRRQHSIAHFILDFFCEERRLAIELDGGQHFTPAALAYDARRSQVLADRNIAVVRFTNVQVLCETEAVLMVIAGHLGIDLQTAWPTGRS